MPLREAEAHMKASPLLDREMVSGGPQILARLPGYQGSQHAQAAFRYFLSAGDLPEAEKALHRASFLDAPFEERMLRAIFERPVTQSSDVFEAFQRHKSRLLQAVRQIERSSSFLEHVRVAQRDFASDVARKMVMDLLRDLRPTYETTLEYEKWLERNPESKLAERKRRFQQITRQNNAEFIPGFRKAIKTMPSASLEQLKELNTQNAELYVLGLLAPIKKIQETLTRLKVKIPGPQDIQGQLEGKGIAKKDARLLAEYLVGSGGYFHLIHAKMLKDERKDYN